MFCYVLYWIVTHVQYCSLPPNEVIIGPLATKLIQNFGRHCKNVSHCLCCRIQVRIFLAEFLKKRSQRTLFIQWHYDTHMSCRLSLKPKPFHLFQMWRKQTSWPLKCRLPRMMFNQKMFHNIVQARHFKKFFQFLMHWKRTFVRISVCCQSIRQIDSPRLIQDISLCLYPKSLLYLSLIFLTHASSPNMSSNTCWVSSDGLPVLYFRNLSSTCCAWSSLCSEMIDLASKSKSLVSACPGCNEIASSWSSCSMSTSEEWAVSVHSVRFRILCLTGFNHSSFKELSKELKFLWLFSECVRGTAGWHTPEVLHCTELKVEHAAAEELGTTGFWCLW